MVDRLMEELGVKVGMSDWDKFYTALQTFKQVKGNTKVGRWVGWRKKRRFERATVCLWVGGLVASQSIRTCLPLSPTHPPIHRVQHLIQTASFSSIHSITHPPTFSLSLGPGPLYHSRRRTLA